MEPISKSELLMELKSFRLQCDRLAQITGRQMVGYPLIEKTIRFLEQEGEPAEVESKTWTCCGGVELDKSQSCPFCGDKY